MATHLRLEWTSPSWRYRTPGPVDVLLLVSVSVSTRGMDGNEVEMYQ